MMYLVAKYLLILIILMTAYIVIKNQIYSYESLEQVPLRYKIMLYVLYFSFLIVPLGFLGTNGVYITAIMFVYLFIDK